ncbi:hypothetical protein ACFL3F_00875, partial [Planctomycetota bacterium]
QTVELGGGQLYFKDGYTPVVLTGFSGDAYVDITMECDYETDTLTYTVTDGVKTESGTAAYVSTGASGNGSGWTLLADDGAVGWIDHVTRTIHGSGANSPYDINQDGTVDQLDLDILEAEMAQ